MGKWDDWKLHFRHDGRIGTEPVWNGKRRTLVLIDWCKKDVQIGNAVSIGISSDAREPFPPFGGPSVHNTHKKSATMAEPEKDERQDHHPCQAMSTFFGERFARCIGALKLEAVGELSILHGWCKIRG